MRLTETRLKLTSLWNDKNKLQRLTKVFGRRLLNSKGLRLELTCPTTRHLSLISDDIYD